MASLFNFGEDNGAAAGNPAKGTTRTFNRAEANLKNIDDSTTAYTASVITTGNNSFSKYQWGVFSGTFNTIQNVKWGHTTGILGAGLTLYTQSRSGYVTPATTLIATPIDVTQPSGIASSSQAVVLGQVGPEQAGAASLTTSGYTNYLITQLATNTLAVAGDTATWTFTLSYDES